MHHTTTLAMALAMATTTLFVSAAHADRGGRFSDDSVQLGPRPFYLVQGMDDGKLKDRLMQCENGPFYRTDFSIAHRGGALLFP